MTQLMAFLIERRLSPAAYLLWFLAIPIVLLIGAIAGIFCTAQDWLSNLAWIKHAAQKATDAR